MLVLGSKNKYNYLFEYINIKNSTLNIFGLLSPRSIANHNELNGDTNRQTMKRAVIGDLTVSCEYSDR